MKSQMRENLDEFDSRVDRRATVGRGMAHLPGMVKKGPRGEDLYVVKKMYEIYPQLWKDMESKYMPVAKEIVEEQIIDTQRTIDRYVEMVKKFRGEVKNDVSSIKNSSDTIDMQVKKMAVTYKETSAMLTSPQFEKAIANAERLAAALQAISSVQANNITFAVLGNKPVATSP